MAETAFERAIGKLFQENARAVFKIELGNGPAHARCVGFHQGLEAALNEWRKIFLEADDDDDGQPSMRLAGAAR